MYYSGVTVLENRTKYLGFDGMKLIEILRIQTRFHDNEPYN